MKHVSPEDLLEFVRAQKEVSLFTLKRRKHFKVRVAGDDLEFFPLKTQTWNRHEFKLLRRVCGKFSEKNSFEPSEYEGRGFGIFGRIYTLALIQKYLESAAAEPRVQVSGGGFAASETRAQVEIAAIAFVLQELNRRGFQVHDRQIENRGYDLEAFDASSNLLVEVKGTDSSEPQFFLTRNEHRCSQKQAEWRLFVVCNARSAPVLHEYTADEMHRQFTLDPLAWECIRNDS